MKSLKKQRRIQVVFAAVLALIAATALIGYGMRDGINFYRSPSEVVAAPPKSNEVFRIGGLVEEGSLKRGEGAEVTFKVTDTGASVKVAYRGVLPDLFEENQGMIATGTYDGAVFKASKILAKHDETYMPKEVVDSLKKQGVYRHGEDQPDGS